MSGPHPLDHRCFDCATDDELAASIPLFPGTEVPAQAAATPGQAAYEARQRSHWERRLHRHGDRPPTPWADLTAGQRADEDAAAQAASAIAVTAERERIRQMAIACRAVAISPTGRMTPFAELLERSPEENAAALLKVVEDARTGLGGGDHA